LFRSIRLSVSSFGIVAMTCQRIVSLLPSCTEIVCALGLEHQLVGRSHECDYPPSIRYLPACTAPKLNPSASSAEIDRQVKELLRQTLSIYSIADEQLRALRPDIILTQLQCEVCAVTGAEVEAAVGDWIGSCPQILSLAPDSLGDLWNDILRVAKALGVSQRGAQLIDDLQMRCLSLQGRIARLQRHPSVACIEWLEPLMAAGNWVPDLVELAGGLNLFGEAGKHSPWLNWDAVREHDPEFLIVMPCGFDLARTRREMPALTHRSDWAKLRAVKSQHVYLTDGNQYFNRPGPRLIDSMEILAEILHPQVCHFGYRGKGWENL
jgi:iron complex transport system substrate-binding protein